jgi:K+-sensing histidine kinase KdpD
LTDPAIHPGTESDPDGLFYLAGGPAAAILLGVVLVPWREATVASNFTFLFMALTIVVAEWGGRRAALATAVAATLSLDFFLTRPYLRLTIDDKHDAIAFFGLAGCGLLAATLGASRGRQSAALQSARRHLALLHLGLRQMEVAGPVEPALARMLESLRKAIPLAAAVVRDEHGRIVAASERAHGRSIPGTELEADAVAPTPLALTRPRTDLLSREGTRIRLVAGNHRVGWLEVWGDGDQADLAACRLLCDMARLLAARLGEERAEVPALPLAR